MKLELLYKSFKVKDFKEQQKEKYGGHEHLDAPPAELLLAQTEDYVEYIIDVGSGKGYLSSFLSLKYGLNVYGINSSNTNTHGAKERNRKLKKHWNLNHCQTIVDVNRLALKMPKEIGAQKEIKCKGEFESVPKSSLGNQDVSSNVLPEFSESAVSAIRKQLGDLHALPLEEEKLYFENTFSLMDFLPIDAIEPTSFISGAQFRNV
ncbi:Uncharacterized protein C12orf26-like [Cricetulus griseus]|uniref:Uncharacterized protein C12orf26-like n=1 Tax=Cricetulus griseus TaxID=10029 RepID=G3I551_CRIGR|nr:Uncharacterized protein C12orf26-like [Cricetulus griseus]